jgi:hypothetical protein
MSLSLLRIGAKKRRMSITCRLLAAWLSLSLFLTLTPCCKVFADAVALPTTNAVLDHEHDGPDGALRTPGPNDFHVPCTKWLDHADYAVGSLHAAVTSGPDSHQNIPIASLLLLIPHIGTMVTAQLSYYSPPDPTLPLYLRIEHLLL